MKNNCVGIFVIDDFFVASNELPLEWGTNSSLNRWNITKLTLVSYISLQELLPHDDQYPSESEKVLKELINSSTGTVSLTEVPYTIEEWLCNNSHGSNFNRISHKFGDSLSYRVTSNVSLPQGHCLPVTDPVRIQELSQELKQQLWIKFII